ETEVINGGLLGEHKGINLPGTPVSLPSITDKDKADLAFGLKYGVDMVAMSFVRTADDVLQAKRYIGSLGGHVPVIAKLEKPQAIENLESIFEVADGVMVARGDLGVEVPPEQVPIIQKHIIRRALDWRKPVITATQMLESMIENPRPTRAEASDVANAIFDGTDAVMLSAETASGKYPIEAVKMMSRIVIETEAHMDEILPWKRRRERRQLSISETICESVAHAAEDLEMKAISVFTQTGTTARLVSKYHPKCLVYAFAHEESITNQMNLFWGVEPVLCDISPTAEDMVRGAEKELSARGVVKNGDVMGVISGTIGASGSTNIMRLHTVGTDNISGDLKSERRKRPRLRPASAREKK
ncbi:MAG TPA: pyruvate kinase, partial [Terriglobales bacterium]|nr:pyruvate kinase [Terriglobales bacterium]